MKLVYIRRPTASDLDHKYHKLTYMFVIDGRMVSTALFYVSPGMCD